jgi:hypothetical protein
MGRDLLILSSVLAVFLLLCPSAHAAETINYTYDALGRVKTAAHVDGDNNGMAINYTYDPAGNRTQYVVAGSKNKGRVEGGVSVVPLNGFTIIPVGQ